MPVAEVQQAQLFLLTQAMFKAAPGAVYMAQFTDYLNSPGATVATLAGVLATTPVFKGSMYADTLTNSAFAGQFVENLVGATVNAGLKAAVADLLASMLSQGRTRGDVIYFAATALAAVDSSDADWGAAATQFRNKAEVAKYYTLDKAGAAVDLATLQAVTHAVSDNSASVAAIKATLDSVAAKASPPAGDAPASDTPAPAADTTAPTLISSTPADNDTFVFTGSFISLVFNENVMAGAGNIVIRNEAGDTQTIAAGDTSQLTVVGSIVTINPVTDWAFGSKYNVQMASGVIKDLTGNAYAGISDATTLNFTTMPPVTEAGGTQGNFREPTTGNETLFDPVPVFIAEPVADTLAPILTSSAPADNASGVLSGSNIVLTFSESVMAGTGDIVISNGAGDTRTIAVGDASQVIAGGNSVSINPAADLIVGSNYNVQMASGVIKDLAGNAYAGISGAATLNFAVIADTFAPVLLSNTSADNATGVAKNSNLILRFDENVAAGKGDIVISNGAGDTRTIAVGDASQVSFVGAFVGINPAADLLAGAHYNVQIGSGVITDLAGNPFIGIVGTSMEFTTV